MKEIGLEELKKRQLAILNAVTEFCEKNHLLYWLDYGTLLGAIRHKGYIPWDDDIDIGMLRQDYDEFMRAFNTENNRYKLYCFENDPTFPFAYGKVIDTETVLYEPDEKGLKLGINIDVFIYDNALGKEDAIHRYRVAEAYKKLRSLRLLRHKPKGSLIRRAMVIVGRIIVKPFPVSLFIRGICINAKKYADIDTDFVGGFTGYSRVLLKKKLLLESTKTEFEGKFYRIPSGYDEVLKSIYGNYMELPPEEDRINPHKFKAYVNEEESEI